jgi:hypothetical protein
MLPVGDQHECSTHLDHGISSTPVCCHSFEPSYHLRFGDKPSAEFLPEELVKNRLILSEKKATHLAVIGFKSSLAVMPAALF